MKSRILIQYVLLALTWGSSFFFVSVGLEGLSPTQIVLARVVSGAVALALVSLATRQALPKVGVVWLHILVVALLLCVAPFLLFAWAQRYVSSSVASIFNATTPLMTMLVAMVALPAERPNRARVGGLLLGFLGVVLVLEPWQGLHLGAEMVGEIACLAATFCYGVAFVYLRRFVSPRGLAAVPVATLQVGMAAAVMILLAPFVALQPVAISPAIVCATLVLGVLGTGLAYVWNTNIVAAWGATPASTVTYLTPVVGIALGTIVLGEHLGWYQPIGAAMVVLGILVSQERLAPLLRTIARRTRLGAPGDKEADTPLQVQRGRARGTP